MVLAACSASICNFPWLSEVKVQAACSQLLVGTVIFLFRASILVSMSLWPWAHPQRSCGLPR